uniref:Conserved hypothetical protein CHP03032 domain-containing protein n=1 Tax=viral metagenome TaxID=1070528 RepID=A0A6C0IX38_9ZZZZ
MEVSEQDSEKIRGALGLPADAKLSVETKNQLPPHKRGANEMENPSRPQFEIHASPEAAQFFYSNNLSLLLSAYKSNLVFAFGATDDHKLSCYYSQFFHPLALGLSQREDCLEVWIASNGGLLRCVDAGEKYNEADEHSGGGGNFTATLVPRQAHLIGKQDVHGIYPLSPQSPFFVSTKFSALCQLDITKPDVNVNVVWKPSFITELRGEDRCHFNDVCWVDGLAKYASCICESDAHDGWRDHRQGGGVIIDIMNDKIVARNLSMPHSPRWYKKQLWVLNSGSGHLGTINLENGTFEPKVFIPGFLRGLQFHGRFAIVGSSLDRHERRFQDLELGKNLETKKTTPVCGFFFIDLASFSIAQKVEIKGNIHEIYDILLVPTRRVRLINASDEDSACVKVVDNSARYRKKDDENEEEK